MQSLVIGGDLCPTGRNELPLRSADGAVFGDLSPEFRQGYAIANLECPLINSRTPISKVGPVLGAHQECIRGLASAGLKLLSLANNHIMDHGPAGLRSTMAACRDARIECFGAGENLAAAARPFILDLGGLKVAIVAMAEHEFSIATPSAPGASSLDVMAFVRTMQQLKGAVDRVVVLLHGGNEGYLYPRPGLMNLCRFMIEQGACAVICQHSHCAGCCENYKDGLIVYGQGNLLFDLPSRMADPQWRTGLLVKLHLEKQGPVKYELVPIEQPVDGLGVRRMAGQCASSFLRDLDARSAAIQAPGFVERQWLEFSLARYPYYLSALRGFGRVRYRIWQYLRRAGLASDGQNERLMLNMIRCESHREAIETSLLAETKGNIEGSSGVRE